MNSPFNIRGSIEEAHCERCNRLLDPSKDKCDGCGKYAAPPNVRLARQNNERLALDAKYQNTINNLHSDHKRKMKDMVQFINQNKEIVISRSAGEIKVILDKGGNYPTWHIQILGEAVRAGYGGINQIRNQFENAVLPYMYKNIRFGAMSVNGKGADFFGNTHMVLNEELLENRTSCFFGNPLSLAKKLTISLVELFPEGLRSDWDNAYKLVISKHVDDLVDSDNDGDKIQNIICYVDDENLPDYIEVHIFDGFPLDIMKRLIYTGSRDVNNADYHEWLSLRSKVEKDLPDVECIEL